MLGDVSTGEWRAPPPMVEVLPTSRLSARPDMSLLAPALLSAFERKLNNSKRFKAVCLRAQARICLCVPHSLDSGYSRVDEPASG